MKILLVEDDKMHADFLKEIVENALPELAEILIARDGKEAEVLAQQSGTTAIVMDLRMKEHNGIDAARTIWARRRTPVFFFGRTTRTRPIYAALPRLFPIKPLMGMC